MKDANDILCARGPAGLRAAFDAAVTHGSNLPFTGHPNSAEIIAFKLRAVALDEFLKRKFPPREMILSPLLPVAGLAMLYAPRGVGKTHVALGIAYAVASGGSFLRWKAPAARKVIFIDGEMAAAVLQERLAQIVANADSEAVEPSFLRILASDMHRDGLPDLSDPVSHRMFNDAIGDADLIIVDNLSTLCRTGRENEAESWGQMQSWALSLRRAGKTVLFVHHAGKGGAQRGTSRREDVLDTVVNLRRPEDYKPGQGARFEVHFEKTRGFLGKDAEPFEATLVGGKWAMRDLTEALENRIVALSKEGLAQRDIAKEVNKSAATINRILKKQKEGS
jgi:putative DNA primase/helicase